MLKSNLSKLLLLFSVNVGGATVEIKERKQRELNSISPRLPGLLNDCSIGVTPTLTF